MRALKIAVISIMARHTRRHRMRGGDARKPPPPPSPGSPAFNSRVSGLLDLPTHVLKDREDVLLREIAVHGPNAARKNELIVLQAALRKKMGMGGRRRTRRHR